jgi:hypothetical protein
MPLPLGFHTHQHFPWTGVASVSFICFLRRYDLRDSHPLLMLSLTWGIVLFLLRPLPRGLPFTPVEEEELPAGPQEPLPQQELPWPH